MVYLRDQNFMAMVGGMPVKPSRMEDAWMMFQLANFCNGLPGDYVLMEPELWAARIFAQIASQVGKTVHIVSMFNEDLHGSREEFQTLLKGFSGYCQFHGDGRAEIGGDWAMVYLNSEQWLDSNAMYERIVDRGCVFASMNCGQVLQGWPQVLTIRMPTGPTIYLMR